MAARQLMLLCPAELVQSWSRCDSKGGVAAWLGVQQGEQGELARKTNTGHQQLAFTNWDTPPKAVVITASHVRSVGVLFTSTNSRRMQCWSEGLSRLCRVSEERLLGLLQPRQLQLHGHLPCLQVTHCSLR